MHAHDARARLRPRPTGPAPPPPPRAPPSPRAPSPQANQLIQRVKVTDGAHLTQMNMWADDCVIPEMPFSCFTVCSGGGARIHLHNFEMSDATCTRVRDSKGISTMIFAAQYAKALTVKVRKVNERTTVIEDTGWVPYLGPSAYWRMQNLTFSCTGNVTHTLPPAEFEASEVRHPPRRYTQQQGGEGRGRGLDALPARMHLPPPGHDRAAPAPAPARARRAGRKWRETRWW